jgi:hypothetical protein
MSEQQTEATETATVARGRSLDIVVDGKRRVVGYLEGKPVHGPVFRRAGPGEEVELQRDEIVRLKRLGFLVDDTVAATRHNADLSHAIPG